LVGVDQLVLEVLLRGILAHLDAGSPNYSGVVGTRLGLHSEKLPEEYPVGFDPQEGFTEVDKDRCVEDTVAVEIEVLDAIVLQEPLEEISCWERQPRSANRVNMGISSGFFSMGYRSPAAARHISTSFSRRNPLLRSASRSSVFAFDFFHSWLGFGHGGDTGDVPATDPVGSSRDLFFPPAVFKLFDGEGFILQVHRVFTRIRSGATAVAFGGGALISTISSEVAVRTGGGFKARSARNGCKCVG
jgi:hypothetical protein